MTDGQSVSMSWYRAPVWVLRQDITSCLNVAVWNLLSYLCEVPSLTRDRVCNLQCNHSMVLVTQSPLPYFTALSETPPNLKGQVFVFISPRNRVAQLYPRALGSLYVVSYDSPLTTCRAMVAVSNLFQTWRTRSPCISLRNWMVKSKVKIKSQRPLVDTDLHILAVSMETHIHRDVCWVFVS
jgi:hypothetical protein